jgi:hypothetical protein
MFAAGASAAPLSWDAVAGFNTTGVQTGTAWTYGTETSLNGTLTLFQDFAAVSCLQDTSPCLPSSAPIDSYYYQFVANGPAVVYNGSGGTITFPVNPALVWPDDVLLIGPGSTSAGTPPFTDVRWTASQAGVYNISGLFENLQAATTDQYVYLNGVTQLFSGTYTGSVSIQKQSFAFSSVSIAAGGTLDFIVDSGGNLSNQGNDSVGFSATITSATPEPNAFGLLSLGSGAIAFALRRLQRAKA